MKTPGDIGHQGIVIDQLDTQSTIGYADAVQIAAELGAATATYDPETDTIEIDPDFVINAIDLREHTVFLWEGHGRFEVLSSNQYSPGLTIINPDAFRTEGENRSAFEFSEAFSYARLWRDWLRGQVVPLDRTTTYVRRDTGDQVLVRDEHQTRIEPEAGDIAYVGNQRGLISEVRTDGESDDVVLEAEVDLHDEPLAEDEWVVPIPDLDRLERPIDD